MLQELAGLGVSQLIEPGDQVCLETDLFANIDTLQAAYAGIPERYTDCGLLLFYVVVIVIRSFPTDFDGGSCHI